MIAARDLLQLARPRVAGLVAAASLFGGALHGGFLSGAIALAAMGSFVLCAGCSALNQVQERSTDALMVRTAHRPVASGRMGTHAAAIIGIAWMLTGLILFFEAAGLQLALVGLAVIALYNGLYTPLKRTTPMALLVGAVAGALPPLTGWLAAGGAWDDSRILAATGVYYLWQVPHFWLLAERHADDYSRAGLPVAGARLPHKRYRQLMALWVLAFFMGAALAAGPGMQPAAAASLTVATLALGSVVATWAMRQKTGMALAAVNAAIVVTMAAMLATR